VLTARGSAAPYAHRVPDEPAPQRPERSGLRAVPPITWIGAFFAVLGLALQDVRALAVGGACLLVAVVQGLLDR
jgi:hypothetical protein